MQLKRTNDLNSASVHSGGIAAIRYCISHIMEETDKIARAESREVQHFKLRYVCPNYRKKSSKDPRTVATRRSFLKLPST